MNLKMAQTSPDPKISNDWNSVFPTSIQNDTNSCDVMKRLLALSVSNILYVRGIFPEDAFCNQEINGRYLKMMNDSTKPLGMREVVGWVKACFDALERKYLRRAIFGIYLDERNTYKLLEAYIFRFSYTENETIISVNNEASTSVPKNITADMIKMNTVNFIKSIEEFTENLKPLPPICHLTIKLLYYDEMTPKDYEPAGFESCSHYPYQFEGDYDAPILKVRKLNTYYHTMSMSARSWALKGNTDNNNNSSQQSNHLSQNSQHEKPNKENVPEQIPEPVGDDEFDIVCPCGDVTDDGLMVGCEDCKKWQHIECFGVLKIDAIPTLHICDSCHGTNGQECSDPIIASLPPNKRKDLALYRRILRHCARIDEAYVTLNQIMKKLEVERFVAQNIMKQMESEKYLMGTKITKNVQKGSKKIDKKRIEEDGSQKYFNPDYDITLTSFYKAASFEAKKGPSKRKPAAGDANTSNSSLDIFDNTDLESVISKTESLSIDPEPRNSMNKRKTNQLRPGSGEGDNELVENNPNKRAKNSQGDKNINV